jgi:hypothetical protein
VRHIKLENNVAIDYPIEQLLVDVPDAVIYKNSQMPHPEMLANYNVYPLVTTPRPSLNEDETAEEGVPEFKDGECNVCESTCRFSIIENRLKTEKELFRSEIQEGAKNRNARPKKNLAQGTPAQVIADAKKATEEAKKATAEAKKATEEAKQATKKSA